VGLLTIRRRSKEKRRRRRRKTVVQQKKEKKCVKAKLIHENKNTRKRIVRTVTFNLHEVC